MKSVRLRLCACLAVAALLSPVFGLHFGAARADVVTVEVTASVAAPHAYHALPGLSGVLTTGDGIVTVSDVGVVRFADDGTLLNAYAGENVPAAAASGVLVQVSGTHAALRDLAGGAVLQNITLPAAATAVTAVAMGGDLRVYFAGSGTVYPYFVTVTHGSGGVVYATAAAEDAFAHPAAGVIGLTAQAETLYILGYEAGVPYRTSVFSYNLSSKIATKVVSVYGLTAIAATESALFLAGFSGLYSYSPSGTPLAFLAVNGEKPLSEGGLVMPAALSVYGNRLYAADGVSGAVQTFDTGFSFVSTPAAAGGADVGRLAEPTDAAVGADGLLVAEAGNRRVSLFSDAAATVAADGYAARLAVDLSGVVYTAYGNAVTAGAHTYTFAAAVGGLALAGSGIVYAAAGDTVW
ncbi:MAG: hypothetical protein LBM78_04310, partial [Clostridiales bacterium]|nr:hypothetical protein [Clostridiales bacterium]